MRCYFCGHVISRGKGNQHHVYGKHKGPKVWCHRTCHKNFHREMPGNKILKINWKELAREVNAERLCGTEEEESDI